MVPSGLLYCRFQGKRVTKGSQGNRYPCRRNFLGLPSLRWSRRTGDWFMVSLYLGVLWRRLILSTRGQRKSGNRIVILRFLVRGSLLVAHKTCSVRTSSYNTRRSYTDLRVGGPDMGQEVEVRRVTGPSSTEISLPREEVRDRSLILDWWKRLTYKKETSAVFHPFLEPRGHCLGVLGFLSPMDHRPLPYPFPLEWELKNIHI